jgi:type VI secretion system secreted protein VgrG
MAFQLTQTTVHVEGNDADIIFSNLFINQQLADVNSFSFDWRQAEGEASLSTYISFYTNNLAKEVKITIGTGFTFKGIISSITCNNQDTLGVSYNITGKGFFEKLNQIPECKSFYKKSITQIFNEVNNTQGTTLNLSPTNTSDLFYTVQYNQSGFSFLRMMAARYGEWLYYDGVEMVLGPPTGETITLHQGADITDIDISAKLVRAPQNNSSFDRHSGEELTDQPQNSNGNGFIGASQQAGDAAFGNSQNKTNITAAATPQLLTDMGVLSQKAAAASAVVVRATSSNSTLKLASKIKIMDAAGNSAGEYYITEIYHAIAASSNYQNTFVAIPAEVEVPPYTNPLLVPQCKAQPAKIVDNEDADGLDRVKVHFPWQGSGDTTPWINVITPHAGKDKGIRFLPEIGDEVMIDFLDSNAERPYVLGALHTEKNKSGNAHESNSLKVIGTKTGRRLEINDDEKYIKITDNFKGKKPINKLQFDQGNEYGISAYLASVVDNDNGSNLELKNGERISLRLVKGGDEIISIKFESDGKKLFIKSKGSIEINADESISLNAPNININGSQKVKVEGMDVVIDASKELKAKGLTATFEGDVTADFKAGAMATLKAGIVKIN